MTEKTNFIKTVTSFLYSSIKLVYQYRFIVIALGLFLFTGTDLIAQPPPPGGTGPSCWPPPCIPIDGGISWLIAAGIAYGAKKSWDFSKKKVE